MTDDLAAHIRSLHASGAHRTAELLREMGEDGDRLRFLYLYVRDALEAPEGTLARITMLCGDAPADCGCREVACPHKPQFPPSLETIRCAVDSARAALGRG